MKRIITLLISVIMVMLFVTGCGTTAQTTNKKVELSATLKELKEAMVDGGFIPDKKDSVVETGMTPVKQKGTDGKTQEYGGYLVVGAVEGVRYSFKYNESDVNLELYRFDKDKANDTTKKVIGDVKSTGKFTIGEGDSKEEIEATLSSDETFLLIYQDESTDKKNQTQKADAEKLVKEYKVDSEKSTKADEKSDAEETKGTESTEETTEKADK